MKEMYDIMWLVYWQLKPVLSEREWKGVINQVVSLLKPWIMVSLLCGWYLMVPQVRQHQGKWYMADSEPVSSWIQAGEFDSASDCWNYSGNKYYQLRKSWGKHDADVYWNTAKCIASDDPRLQQ